MLLQLLLLRFGTLPTDTVARVQAADPETLLHWSERVLSAATLEGLGGVTAGWQGTLTSRAAPTAAVSCTREPCGCGTAQRVWSPASSSRSPLASWRSAVSKPSVNQP